MRGFLLLLVALPIALLGMTQPALAQTDVASSASGLPGVPEPTPPALAVGLRSGDHPGFGRLVVDLPSGVRAEVQPGSDRFSVRLESGAGSLSLRGGVRPPRNVTAVAFVSGRVEVTYARGAGLRTSRLGDRLVLDVTDPPPATVASPAARSMRARNDRASLAAPASSPQRRLSTVVSKGPSPDARYRDAEEVPTFTGQPPPPQSLSTPLAVPQPPTMPTTRLSLAASPPVSGAQPGAAASVPAISLPFSSSTGAAALRRGDTVMVVFDERRPLDLGRFRADPVFGTASIVLLPDATLLRLKLSPGRELRLSHNDAGWTVALPSADHAPSLLNVIRADPTDGQLRLGADAPGKVVAVPDPLTESTLLVGTQRVSGQGMQVDRRTPEFALLPTWQGVAVLPNSDSLVLRSHARGFVLAVEAGTPLALSPTDETARALAEAAHASRHYDLQPHGLDALHRRLQSATLAAATAPPQARAARRREVAEALLALGLGAEMQAVTAIAMAEDPRAAADPDMVGLAAIAALLAGRADEAGGIEDPRLTGTDEVALWRAMRMARSDPGSPRAASVLASAMPLLLSYPAPLRDRLLPLALETMALGGEAAAAAAAADRVPDLAALDLARAYAAEQSARDRQAVLALYDKIADGQDRRARVRASRRAVEIRLAAGAIAPSQAADVLDRLVYAWRGDEVEVETRLRIAELRTQAGAFRTTLAGLREVQMLFPERDATIREELAAVFGRSLAPDSLAGLAPLDLVALAEENADLMPTGAAGLALAERLAVRLAALDLPGRAVAVLERLVAEASPGVGRAALGDRLAALRLQEGGAAAALAVLSATVVEGPLPPALLESRTMTFARASAAAGDLPTGLAALSGIGTPSARDLRATLLEQAEDWPAAAATLAAMATSSLPESGPLDGNQARLVLRLAAAAARAGDSALLAGLRKVQVPRMPPAMRDLLQVVVAAPVQGVDDLPRAAREARLARGMPLALRGISDAPAP